MHPKKEITLSCPNTIQILAGERRHDDPGCFACCWTGDTSDASVESKLSADQLLLLFISSSNLTGLQQSKYTIYLFIDEIWQVMTGWRSPELTSCR